MLLSFLLYAGAGTLALGALRSRRLAILGAFAAGVALAWPSRKQRVATPVTRLDEVMPEWQFNEIHTIEIAAPAERVFAAVLAVTAREIKLFRTLTAIRRLGRSGPEGLLNPHPDSPIMEVATRTIFRVVVNDPPREIVVHTTIRPDVRATMNFLVAPISGGSRLTTETRVFSTTEAGARRFGLYWRTILPGSDIIRRMWLRAVKIRAEAAFTIRKAVAADIAGIERVMRESLTGIGSRTYSAQQIASSLEHIAHLDQDLVNDNTYFVAEVGGAIVGCGGWSRRAKLYAGSAAAGDESRMLDPEADAARVRAMFVVPRWERRGIGRRILDLCEREAREAGFRRVELMAMLSGRAMYDACGYLPVEDVEPPLADGTLLPLTKMEKTLREC